MTKSDWKKKLKEKFGTVKILEASNLNKIVISALVSNGKTLMADVDKVADFISEQLQQAKQEGIEEALSRIKNLELGLDLEQEERLEAKISELKKKEGR